MTSRLGYALEKRAQGVSFAAAGLEPAAYEGLLDLETNDPLAAHIGVPVTLTVKPGRWHAHLPVIQMRR